MIQDKENFSPAGLGRSVDGKWGGSKWAAMVTYEADKQTKIIGERVSLFNWPKPKSFSLVLRS